MYNIIEYNEATSIEETLLLLESDCARKIVAGGTDVLINMYYNKLKEVKLVGIQRVKELKGINLKSDGSIVIGPLSTFTQILEDNVLKGKIPNLQEAAVSMGGPQIRNIATIGGNVCNGAPSADSAPTLLCLNAKVKVKSRSEEKIVPLENFYKGPGKVCLAPNEIVTAIIIDKEDYEGFSGKYIKFSKRKAMDLATLSVACMCELDGNKFSDVRIALGVAGPTPLRCKEAEDFARGKKYTDDVLIKIGQIALKFAKPRDSWRGSKEYREHLIETLVKRALEAAIKRSGGNTND